MDGCIDELIDSDEYADDDLLLLLGEGVKPTALTLLKYLSKGFTAGVALSFQPKASIVEALLVSGATPYYYGSGKPSEKKSIMNLPSALHSTLNVAVLIGNQEIVKLLLQAGEKPNFHTISYVDSPGMTKLLTSSLA